ncbi:hypothetical protein KBA63_00190 [Candidatus Woesebacteria bacterium]|nr:hypothetical protein [Candidatus Woesebacteria bacterium]
MNKTPSWLSSPSLTWYHYFLGIEYVSIQSWIDYLWQSLAILTLFVAGFFLAFVTLTRRERAEKEALISRSFKLVTDTHNENLKTNKSRIILEAELLRDGSLVARLSPSAESRKVVAKWCIDPKVI